MENTDGFVVDDDETLATFRAAGHQVESVPWTNRGDFSRFDVVIVRSTWDYQAHSAAFLEALSRIDAQTHLENDLALMTWNIDKVYLRELEDAGIAIVPTAWDPEVERVDELFDSDELILKPSVSANADNTYRFARGALPLEAKRDLFEHKSVTGAIMCQPFLPSILDEGEVSLFYFDGAYSHAVNKRPKSGDFRVQEEHGGIITSVTPSADVFSLAERALEALPVETPPLYARVDIVDDQYVIEVELIEPALYFRTHKDAPANFVRAIGSRLSLPRDR